MLGVLFSFSLLFRSFDTKAGQWHDVHLPFEEFIPLFRAKTVKDGSKLDPSTVTSVQVSKAFMFTICASQPQQWLYVRH